MSAQTCMSAQTRSAAELDSATEPTREKGVREACAELEAALSALHVALQELSTDMKGVLLSANTTSDCDDAKSDDAKSDDAEPKREECGWARAIREHSHQISNATELVQDLRTRLDA